MKHLELLQAYHKVLSEARHVMALHRRVEMILGACRNDGEKLMQAIEHAQRLEQEFTKDNVTILSGG